MTLPIADEHVRARRFGDDRVFVRDETNPDLRRRVLTGTGVAPELIDLEAANVIRKWCGAGNSPLPRPAKRSVTSGTAR